MTEHLEHLILAYACTEAVGPIVGSYEDSKSEGVYLASKLITNIAQRQYSHVRPELLLLFATESPSQRNAELKPRVTVELNKDRNFQELLDGVWAKLRSDKSRDWESVPLVGCSAAACMADGNVYEDGTVLIALCSVSPNALQNSTAEDVQGRKPTRQRAIRVLKTTCSLEAIDDPNKAAEDLCKNLRLIHAESDFNPHENRFVMLFLPGYRKVEGGDPKYEDPRILRAFCEKTRYEIPVCGGSGAQAFGSRDSGFQFIGDKCYKNAAVAALIECDTQFGIAMNSSFKPMSPPQFIRINVQDDNRRRVEFTAVDTTCDRIEECRKQDTLLILGARNE